jgi:phosphoglycolate phosphatase
MPPAPVTLVLFDIDGTLLEVHGAGRRAFAQAMEALYGWTESLEWIRFAGATDLDIHRQIMERNNHTPQADEIPRFFDQLAVEMKKNLATSTPTLYPGVRELLAALSGDDRALVGLVTGNDETCARLKLAHFNLHEHVLLGAFGHEHGDRRDIARLALQRAHASLPEGRFIGSRFLIGDTPNDILAAQAIEARCIAVSTGRYAPDALLHAGANHVLPDLANVPLVLSILGLGRA